MIRTGKNMQISGRSTGEIAAVALGVSGGVLVLLVVVYLAYRCRHRKKDLGQGEYERILSSHGNNGMGPDGKATLVSNVSMKSIPFSVPSPVNARPTRTDSRLLQDDTTSVGSGSEPSTPSAVSKGSMESLSSTGGGGAYALGSIDPSLYKMNDEDNDYDFGDDHLGRCWFAVEYERESEKLLLTLMKARNLPSRAMGSTNACDPFVRIYLMPDERRYLQSKFKKKTCNPKFEESFVFQVSNKAIQERVLKLTMFDVDRHKRHHVLGHALYPLKEHDYESNERVVIWRDLEREVSEATVDRGEMHISLSYNNHLERITVGVFEGKNLKKSDMTTQPDTYVKVCLLQQNRVVKTKKSEVVKKTSNPAFNESFTYKLAVTGLDTASVTVSTMQSLSGHRDKLLGRVVFGSFMFARGKELDHWNEMIANQREQVSHWHTLT